MNAFLRDAPFDQGIEKIAFANNLTVRKTDDGFYIIEPKATSAEATDATNNSRRRSGRRRTGSDGSPEVAALARWLF